MESSPVQLVVGAAGGIGTEVCRRLVAQGHRLMLVGRTSEPLQALATELGQPHRVADAQDWDALAQAAQDCVETHGGLHGAVNLAGSVLLKPAHITGFDEYQETIAQNVTTAFGLIKAVAPILRRGGGGSVVLMGSAAADIGLANHEAIAAAKAGVAALARSAAATYAGAGIRINTVSPGLVQTPVSEKVWGNERAAAASLAMHPLGRLGAATDIASLIVWLLHPDQTWITGQEIAVDGGLSSIKSVKS
ncbi:SDR family NAD(P)-dependent oxidoreductase [Crateriforma conspicua]|uniref:3-oxoacyl-[acyl-carrier-protein] reductase FabG n=1 Tax=Crateriforma conspicua TaxID=2527996 RepID=A0A5C5Y9X6_9PLAN|nr:SDR family oxidoreductase [Crateriforma conspicua]TWT71934.1 3-oxoacyl-[acyl-carrier-protein] reductase FabG [Crateriforma conspicua]